MPAAFLPPSKSTSMRMPCDVASPHKQRYSHDVQKGQADTASLCMTLVMQSSGAEGTAPRHILTAVLRKVRKGVCRGTATCCCLPAIVAQLLKSTLCFLLPLWLRAQAL
jgi:hypothetical protein